MISGILTIGFISWAVVAIARGPLGQAPSRRIAGRQGESELAHEVLALQEQVEDLRQLVVETQERVDFTERLLARGERAGLERGTD